LVVDVDTPYGDVNVNTSSSADAFKWIAIAIAAFFGLKMLKII
jgi:hypothetical protein